MSITNSTFSRQNLRKASKFTEGDYQGINPREFFRSLKRAVEEFQSDGDFKYRTSEVGDGLNISSESVGEKTGTIEGRLQAESDFEEIGSAKVTYRPYGHFGAWAIVIGTVTSLMVIGIPILVIGIYLYLKKDSKLLHMLKQDVIRILVEGEASERTIESESETRTDIFANMSVIFAGDTFVKVDTDEFEDMPTTYRIQVINRLSKLYNDIIEEEELEKSTYSGTIQEFVKHLASLANVDSHEDKRLVDDIQRQMNNKFEYRLEYSKRLLNQLPTETENELREHQDEILEELKYLADDMDVYVEREGLKPT